MLSEYSDRGVRDWGVEGRNENIYSIEKSSKILGAVDFRRYL